MVRNLMVLLASGMLTLSAHAQKEGMSREDKQEKNEARDARINKKNDLALFRKQMLALKEYADERKKIPALQKASKSPVKIVAFIDSTENDDDEAKTLIGYIRQDVGDNSTNIYEIIYDKAAKKIVTVKRTAEATDADKEAAEDREEAASDKKAAKKTIAKKSKDDDDDDPDDKPAKNHRDKDDD